MARTKNSKYDDAWLRSLEKQVNQANRRIERLEKHGLTSKSKAYASVKGQADKGLSYMRSTKSGAPRFKRGLKNLNDQQLTNLKNKVESFLEKKTTTKTDINKIYGGIRKKLEDKVGHKLSDAQYELLLQSLQAVNSARGAGLNSNQILELMRTKSFSDMSDDEQANTIAELLNDDQASAINKLDAMIGDEIDARWRETSEEEQEFILGDIFID